MSLDDTFPLTLRAHEREKSMENLLQRTYVVTTNPTKDVYLHRVLKDLIKPALANLTWTTADLINGGTLAKRFKATFNIESTRTETKPDSATLAEKMKTGQFYVYKTLRPRRESDPIRFITAKLPIELLIEDSVPAAPVPACAPVPQLPALEQGDSHFVDRRCDAQNSISPSGIGPETSNGCSPPNEREKSMMASLEVRSAFCRTEQDRAN